MLILMSQKNLPRHPTFKVPQHQAMQSLPCFNQLLWETPKNIIGTKTREFEACLLHFPQSYLANMTMSVTMSNSSKKRKVSRQHKCYHAVLVLRPV